MPHYYIFSLVLGGERCPPSSGKSRISSGSFSGWWSIANACCFVGLEWEMPGMPIVTVICMCPSFPGYRLAERRLCPVSLPQLWVQLWNQIWTVWIGVFRKIHQNPHVIQTASFVLEHSSSKAFYLFKLLCQECVFVPKDLDLKAWHDLLKNRKVFVSVRNVHASGHGLLDSV